jgi:hypothetical protein
MLDDIFKVEFPIILDDPGVTSCYQKIVAATWQLAIGC